MYLNELNHVIFPILIIIFFISILGFGTIFDKYTNIYENSLKTEGLIFIQGLFLISIISILINFIFPLNIFVTTSIILIGIVLFVFFFLQNNKKKQKIKFILIVSLLSYVYAYYSGVHDDYSYHYNTILNFNEKNIFQITHDRNISYNSNWLFISSIFYINSISSTLFILGSLLYSIFIFDTYKIYNKSLKEKSYYSALVSFFALIFFLGVINKYKEIGTDFPGVILSFYTLILIVKYKLENKINGNNLFLISFLLFSFAFVIKISNVLLIFYILSLISISLLNKLAWKKILLLSILPILWLFQNYIISGCLIWPIEKTCFINNDKALFETYLIESFAKGDIDTSIDVSGFKWIETWFKNHINKIIETYLVFFLIFSVPIIFFLIRSFDFRKNIFNYIVNIFKKKNYIILFLIIILSNIVWFINAPAYRFGIFYNLTLLIFILLPFWKYLFENNLNFSKKYFTYLFIFVCIYFTINNISKYKWYSERYNIWPPIENDTLIKSK